MTFEITNIRCPFFGKHQFFPCEQGGGHGVTSVKGLFCEHAFTVVTKKKNVSLPRKEDTKKKTRVRDVKSLFCDHPFPVVHFSSAERRHEVRMSLEAPVDSIPV